MLEDIERVCDGERGLACLLPYSSLAHWQSGPNGRISRIAKRAIWLLWVTICRPGAIQTTRDIAFFGRFTLNGNPKDAGKPHSILAPLTRCIDGGQYPKRDPAKGPRGERKAAHKVRNLRARLRKAKLKADAEKAAYVARRDHAAALRKLRSELRLPCQCGLWVCPREGYRLNAGSQPAKKGKVHSPV